MQPLRTIFFDLDDTLYPQDSGLWEAMGKRIHDYITQRLGVSQAEAKSLRAQYLRGFGTTLNGLMANHQIDPLDYLRFVHDIPIEEMLSPDPGLQEMLSALPQQKIIFTNAYREHAGRVLSQLGVSDQFDLIIDIISLEYHNKPHVEAYRRALEIAAEQDGHACLIVDDRSVNLEPAAGLGMTTVLVGDRDRDGTYEPDYHISKINALAEGVPELRRTRRPDDLDIG
jgi:putative hydrolase of the HAD superfamily